MGNNILVVTALKLSPAFRRFWSLKDQEIEHYTLGMEKNMNGWKQKNQ